MFRKSNLILLSVLTALIILLFINCGNDPASSNDSVPVLTTTVVSDLKETTVQCGGNITSQGGASVTARGVCWSYGQMPTVDDDKTTDGSGTGSFVSTITGLVGRSLYYVRAYATNSEGTGYGSVLSFRTTDSTSSVTDIDGNTYKTVKIGSQWWMAENLKVTHYRNGDAITNVTDSATWGALTTEAYCDYNNNVSNVATYGRLYNGYAVSDSRIIAPTGWHVATDAEWQALVDFMGGDAIAGGKLKEAWTTHWTSPNVGATNECGFNALPGGFRFNSGQFYGIQAHGNFWTSTLASSVTAWYRFVHCTNSEVAHFTSGLTAGFSVRCVKD